MKTFYSKLVANNIPTVNSGDTLSLFFRPGEDKRLFNTTSDSILTFGDFRIYRDNTPDSLTGTPKNLSFDGFSTLESLGVEDFTPPQNYSVNYNELNLTPTDPFSYSYFGSFYTEVLYSINKIIEEFPYAILSYGYYTGLTIYDYSTTYDNITGEKTATFKIPTSTLINQGNLIYNSGSTVEGVFSLVDDYLDFAIQMSAQTASATTRVANITSYTFSGDGGYMEFVVDDFLEYVSGSTSYFPVYIRPTKKRYAEYVLGINKLENTLLFNGTLSVPNVETDTSDSLQTFTWPTTIDGFAPDSFGDEFEDYKESILRAAADIDDSKTNIMLKTMIPENYLEMDSSGQIYRNTVQAYAHEFDTIKHYIDGIAYAHSIEYNNEETLPKKFMFKFSNLLGWKLSDAFSEVDLFEYLAGDIDGDDNSYSQFNIEVWRRILININWLYKKKGTRDALQFIFKLIGAPDCLVNFDEFVYKIQSVGNNLSSSALTNSIKVNDNGYINYSESQYIFQEGGKERGNGQRYITQWTPEFNPIKQVDNTKSYIGDAVVFGSEDTVNSKEINITLDPASAIECDVYSFYQQSGTSWDWSSNTPPLSAITMPFEFTANYTVLTSASGLSFSQWLNYIYANSINPRDRKTILQPHTSWYYPELRNIYLNYFFWSNPNSNKVTFLKMQAFLNLIERNFNDYVYQLLPATTIPEGKGTVYRNTLFNRQKFVYKEGISAGSEFQVRIPNYEASLNPITINGVVNDFLEATLNPVVVTGTYNDSNNMSLNPYSITGTVISTRTMSVTGYELTATITVPAMVSRFFGPSSVSPAPFTTASS